MSIVMDNLETADDPRHLRRIAIDPVSRVEGHGKVTLLVDDDMRVRQARLHIVEFRGFERFIQGRPYWELPMVVQRLCGICPVSHHLAAGKAIDMLIGADQLPPTAEKNRRLLHYGQVLQSHALHFFHLASPDLLFGFDAAVPRRNLLALLGEHPDTAIRGIKLRKFGQQIIETLSGKRVHGSLVVPGGINHCPPAAPLRVLQQQLPEIRSWAVDAIRLARDLYLSSPDYAKFAAVESPVLSLVSDRGEFELYHGVLRASGSDGMPILDGLDYCRYGDQIREEVKSWSYMKFPFLKKLGKANGWYRVGPLARLLNCDRMPWPEAEAARQQFLNHCPNNGPQSGLLYHWARMIELLGCAEAIEQLLPDPELRGDDLVAPEGERHPQCYGVIEAPRGTLIHHYQVDDQGLVRKANLIVSTTSNNQAMNVAIRDVCRKHLDGNQITEALLNHIEVAIRAWDPCLSCATHALGRMPLQIELQSTTGRMLQKAGRDQHGEFVSAPG